MLVHVSMWIGKEQTCVLPLIQFLVKERTKNVDLRHKFRTSGFQFFQQNPKDCQCLILRTQEACSSLEAKLYERIIQKLVRLKTREITRGHIDSSRYTIRVHQDSFRIKDQFTDWSSNRETGWLTLRLRHEMKIFPAALQIDGKLAILQHVAFWYYVGSIEMGKEQTTRLTEVPKQ